MANIKISELNNISNIADEDLLAIVDTSASETKKMPLSLLETRLKYTLEIINLLETLGIETNTWNSSDTYSIGDVVVYNTRMYKNLTGTNTSTTPDIDTTNWEQVPAIVNEYSTSDKNAYSSKYINDCNTYSTDEIDTGKYWINGKKIYRKVIYIDSLNYNTTRYINHNISNFEYCTDISWVLKFGGFFASSNYFTNFSEGYYLKIAATNTQIIVNTNVAWGTNSEAYVTLEYTKTTDTAQANVLISPTSIEPTEESI